MLNHRALALLQDLIRPSHLNRAAELVVAAAAVLAFVALLAGYWALPTLPIYGHDAVHYYEEFEFKLVEDGRWLNYLLHDFLRSAPLPLWSLVFLALFWLLFYRLARACAIDTYLAAVVASTTVLAVPFHEMSLWPASMLPALAVTWLAVQMQARGIAYPVIYVVSGALMFGAIQTMYFVLPLLFLRQFLDIGQPARARWMLLFKHLLWWVGGSVVGVMVMSLMLWLLAGIYFPQPPAWRDVHPVVDLASLLANIRFVVGNLADLLPALLRLGGITWAFAIICVGAALLRARTLWAKGPALLLLCAVVFSFFVFSIPLAPIIQMRSLIAMAAAVILFLAILPGRTPLGRVVAALLLLRLAQHYSELEQEYLEVHRAETTVLLDAIHDLFPDYTWTYAAVALDGKMSPDRPAAARFNDGSKMHPVMMSLGVRVFLDCGIPTRCDKIDLHGKVISEVPFAGGHLELAVNPANVAIVRYRE